MVEKSIKVKYYSINFKSSDFVQFIDDNGNFITNIVTKLTQNY